MPLTLAIVGRPNVGKSTLFNRLAGRKLALVDDAPGFTRDRREAPGQIGDLLFTVIDTAGLDEKAGRSLESRMRALTERAVLDADAVLFVIDARAGVTPLDQHFARWLRKLGRPTFLVANKCESDAAAAAGVAEAYGLGFGEPLAVSAEHGEGLADVYAALAPIAPADAFVPREPGRRTKRAAAQEPLAEAPVAEAPAAERAIRIAIVGRPNVGKSTLVNRLLGEERMLAGAEPGITRDAIEAPWRWRGRPFVLIDTAGLRKKARIDDRLERLSAADALRAVRAAQVVILVVDATRMLERQDLQIGRLAAEEGRALVIAVNKWDLVDAPQTTLRQLTERIEASLPQVKGVRFATVSALHGRKLDELMGTVLAAYEIWDAKIATPRLNRWLADMTEAHPPPMTAGRRPRLRFMRQTASRPPTFALFGSKLVSLPEDYLRYLANGLRDEFGLWGTVIRFSLRQTENPYDRG